MRFRICLFLCCCLAQAQQAPTTAGIMTGQLKTLRAEIVPLVEAMPAEKISFVPPASLGLFEKSRSFLLQATHVAAVNYAVCSAILAEKNPTDMGANENGPASIRSKQDAVRYLNESFDYCEKALKTLTAENFTELVPSPFGQGKMPKGAAASIAAWHGFDHYGQMALYARMNGVVPPASR
jgi:uncharacterized damage-inducible protein DinB